MATKPKASAVTAKPARGAKPTLAKRPARAATPPGAPSDPLAAVTAERDALRAEVASLRARVESLTSVRGELQTRLDGVVVQIEKLLGR
jgi:hypothetical protein